ncbi:hypothetical protein RQN30_05340 [Arcanobacterium hippocoleae]
MFIKRRKNQYPKRDTRKENRVSRRQNSHPFGTVGARKTPDLRKYRVSSPLRAFVWRWKYAALILITFSLLQTFLSLESNDGIGSVKVLTANSDIAAGESFHHSNTRIQLYPKDVVPENFVPTAAEIAGKIASTPISKGLPITFTQILDDNYLANAPAGTVITSVNLRDDISVKLLKPGNHVELYAPAHTAGAAAQLLTSDAVVVGKPAAAANSTLFGETVKPRVLYLAIKKSDVNLILGLHTNTPLQAVITKS